MEWIIRFIIVWIVFILLGGLKWKEFKVNVWCGILSMILHLSIDTFAIHMGFYKITNPIISIFGSSIFFTLGPAFVVGMLFSMTIPQKKWAQVIHVLFYSVAFYIEEYTLIKTGGLKYINWIPYGSIQINILSLITLSWFSIVFLKKGRPIE
ncbi:MAG: hypothetical protein ACOYVK_12170 [Bacillota bacterium]